jgi:hypothetical protein
LFIPTELAQNMLPVPPHVFAARELDRDTCEMKQAPMRFVHALLVSTADASTFPVPADAVRRASLQREIEKSPVAA